jgi:hypothetical protein
VPLNAPRLASRLSAAVVAGIAAWSSYQHMVHVALGVGERPDVAYVLPLSVDGMLVVASVAMVDDRRSGRKVRWSARVAFVAGVTASVAANVAGAQPTVGARIVAAWPAVALLLVVELLSRQGRAVKAAAVRLADAAAPEPAPAVEAPATPAVEAPVPAAPRPARVRSPWPPGQVGPRRGRLRPARPVDARPAPRAASTAGAGQQLPQDILPGVADLMRQRGYRQPQIAGALGVNERTLRKWPRALNGATTGPAGGPDA